MRRWALPLVLGLLVFVAFNVGAGVREELGLSFSLEGLEELRTWVAGLGWRGPAVFVALVTFRLFLALSSHVVLILGGLLFGVWGGTAWGALGLLLSGWMQFYAARLLGENWVRARLTRERADWEARIRQLGPTAVFVVDAHPAGPMTPIQLAAGLVGLPLGAFTVAVALGSLVRAATFSVLGTSILRWGPATSIAISLALVLVVVVPMRIPSVRRWVQGAPRDAAPASPLRPE